MNFGKYHVSRNLIDIRDFTATTNPTSQDGVLWTGTLAEGTYTFSINQDDTLTSSLRNTIHIKIGSTNYYESTSANYHNNRGRHSYTFTVPDATTMVEIRYWTNDISNDCSFSQGMLNTGSTALPYEPYSSEVWHDIPHYIHNTSTDTITTLPAVLYPTGTTATVGLKGQAVQSSTPSPNNPIMPNGTGERTGNLWDESTIEVGGLDISTGAEVANSSRRRSGFIKVTPSTAYTLARVIDTTKSNLWVIGYDANKNVISDSTGTRPTVLTSIDGNSAASSFDTTPSTEYIRWYVTVNGSYSNIMLNSGSTALPYEPYGYKLDISSIGENLFDGDYTVAVMSVSGNTATLNTASSGRTAIVKCEPNTTYTVKKYSASNRFIIAESDIKPVNGTAMSIIQNDSSISEYTFTTSNTTQYVGIYCSTSSEQAEPQLMLNLGSIAKPYSPYNHTTTPVYLGEGETTRKIRKIILTGNESSSWFSNVVITRGNAFYNEGIFADYKQRSGEGYCSHYPLATSITATIGVFFGANINFITDFSEDIDTADKWKSYLAAQYAAGTPVTVWYVLATPKTAVVNEPLMKIGEYADEVSNISIPITAGGDTISVDTTVQPSEVTVNYKGWHSVADVHERDNGAWT